VAQRTQARAETVRQHGHALSAREAFLRAYSYYRAALVFMRLRTIPALDRSAASTDLPPQGGDTPRPVL
jgi:hypothetical protein